MSGNFCVSFAQTNCVFECRKEYYYCWKPIAAAHAIQYIMYLHLLSYQFLQLVN